MWQMIYTYLQDFDWNTLLWYGIFFILAGIAIILVPEILIALIAGTLMAIGGLIIYVALQLKKAARQARSEWIEIHFMD